MQSIERAVMGRLPYAAVGTGPPVVVLVGLSPTTGVEGDGIVRVGLGPLARLRSTRRLVVFNRRPDLARGMTMAELAAEHADALRAGFDRPVDVVGISTGGSIAQQLAADHHDVVDRLVLVSTACRLGAVGRELQARVGADIRAGATRRALAVMAGALVPPWRGRTVARAAAWLLGPHVLRNRRDLDDMATTVEAEDGFDLAACATPITAPTLVLGGGLDRFYPAHLFTETAQLIPHSQLRVFPRRGHMTVLGDRGAQAALANFLG